MNKYILLFLFLWFSGCTDDPFVDQNLDIQAEAGVTEVRLKLHVDGLRRTSFYILERDGKELFNAPLQTADTVLDDKTLRPGNTYTYSFFAREEDETSPVAKTTVTTMDTTASNKNWSAVTLGDDKFPGKLYDVDIIDENNIWVVGEIYTNESYDSSGFLVKGYNAANWDGQNWNLININPDFRGTTFISGLDDVFAFGADDIWFCGAKMILHWDGTEYSIYDLLGMGLLKLTRGGFTKIWGDSPSNIYFAGKEGTLVHYDGETWTEISSGTNRDIQDIWGVYDEDADEYEILAVASDESASGFDLIRINGKTSLKVYENSTPSFVSGLWFKPGKGYFLSGRDFYKSRYAPDLWENTAQLSSEHHTKIRGREINDIYAVGKQNLLTHFNGLNWYRHKLEEIVPGAGGLYSVDLYDNLVVAVGTGNDRALIMISGDN